MKNNKKRNKIILLVVVLLGLSIGFAALSTTLRINGLAGIRKNSWSVYWSNAQIVTGSVTSNLPNITQDSGDPVNTKAVWSTTFTEPGQYYGYTIDATNAGTLDALIEDIVTTTTPAELPPYISYSITYADGSPLRPNDLLEKANGNTPTTKKYRVMVSYDPTNEQYDAIPENGVTVSFETKPIYKQVPAVEPKPEPAKVKVTLKSGNVSLKGKTDAELVEYYGTDITGHVADQTDWQLFYSDEDNIYLIAKDYVRNTYLPDELTKSPEVDGNPNYNADIGRCIYINGYQYIDSDIVRQEPWSAGTNSTVLLQNPLTSKYIRWVALYPNNEDESAQALAYMMDTSVWKDFAGNVKGAFAMGGPTLEMFIKSYNSKHENKFSTYDTFVPGEAWEEGANSNKNGYLVKMESESNWSTSIYSIPDEGITMWSPADQGDVNNYWLATPGGYGNIVRSPYMYTYHHDSTGTSTLATWYVGQKSSTAQCYNSDLTGFRPLVAIPKSSLE